MPKSCNLGFSFRFALWVSAHNSIYIKDIEFSDFSLPVNVETLLTSFQFLKFYNLPLEMKADDWILVYLCYSDSPFFFPLTRSRENVISY